MINFKKTLKSFASRRQATILTYHGVIQSNWLFSVPQHISVDLFTCHIEYLSKYFNCISLAELLASMKRGRIKSKSVVITFDDGFHNNYSNAFPILKQYGVPATIFTTSGFIDGKSLIWPETLALILAHSDKQDIVINKQRYLLDSAESKTVAYRALTSSFKKLTADDIKKTIEVLFDEHNITQESIYQSPYYDDFRMLDWPEIKELVESGLVSIGSHTSTHRRLTRLADNEAASEIKQSKQLLEDTLGTIDFFAYPYGGNPGDYIDQHVNIVKDAGYKAAVSCAHGCVSTTSDVYQLPRASVGANNSVESLDYLLNGGNAFPDGFSFKSLLKGIVSGETG